MTIQPVQYAAPTVRHPSMRPAVITLLVGVVINLSASVILAWYTYGDLWGVSAGTSIRPMGLTFLDGVGGFIAFVVSLSFASAALAVGWRWKRIWIVAILLAILGLLPITSAFGVFRWIVNAHHLVLEE